LYRIAELCEKFREKSTLPGTLNAAGQFQDCPGESGAVGYPGVRTDTRGVNGPLTFKKLQSAAIRTQHLDPVIASNVLKVIPKRLLKLA